MPFTTAGVIAGKIEKTDWAGVVKNRIFKPLGMEKTSGTWKEGMAQPDHATAHYYAFDKSVSAISWDEIDHAGGAGCVNSCTARDMAAWLQFQLAGGKYDGRRLLTEKTLKETHTPQMLMKPEGAFAVYFPPKVTRFTSYGLGWFVHDYRGVTCLSHGGTLTGFRALQCMLVPEKNMGVFVMCNLRPSYVTESICKTAIDAVLGLPTEDWVKFHKDQLAALDFQVAMAKKKRETTRKPDTKPSLALSGYVGGYDEPAYGRLEVSVEGDKPMLRWGKYVLPCRALPLRHVHRDPGRTERRSGDARSRHAGRAIPPRY